MTASREELERQVLRALCQGIGAGSARGRARCQLAAYRWSDPIHQVLFECLLELGTPEPARLEAELPARLTRRGFPDVNWEEFFQPVSLSGNEVERLVHELAGI
jgi:hypothetical protein